MEYVEELTIEGVTYQLRTRLGWYDLQAVEDKAFRMFTDGRALTDADDLADVKQIQIVNNTAEHNLARLQARLIGVNRNKLKALPPAHVPILIAKIETYEEEQEAEEEALREGNPTEIPLTD
ncbi:MAG: hypothetical protein KAT00_01550 [Planctomycetes bacterium]|nr:hypothetical protein [Planctomycetota bacterium]